MKRRSAILLLVAVAGGLTWVIVDSHRYHNARKNEASCGTDYARAIGGYQEYLNGYPHTVHAKQVQVRIIELKAMEFRQRFLERIVGNPSRELLEILSYALDVTLGSVYKERPCGFPDDFGEMLAKLYDSGRVFLTIRTSEKTLDSENTWTWSDKYQRWGSDLQEWKRFTCKYGRIPLFVLKDEVVFSNKLPFIEIDRQRYILTVNTEMHLIGSRTYYNMNAGGGSAVGERYQAIVRLLLRDQGKTLFEEAYSAESGGFPQYLTFYSQPSPKLSGTQTIGTPETDALRTAQAATRGNIMYPYPALAYSKDIESKSQRQYYDGLGLILLGQYAEGVEQLEALVESYPDSPCTVDARMIISGENAALLEKYGHPGVSR